MAKRHRFSWPAIIAVGFVLAGQTDALAQGTSGVSRRPPISPYLNRFSRDLGISARDLGYITPYMGFSRPAAPPSRDYTPIQSLGVPSGELLRARAGSQQAAGQGGVMPTGIGSAFMNHTHFYPRPTRPTATRRR